eukprot:CAMPEP_0113534392 /NCGR_PEP_ID=MMETSP0015_2-20120614/5133_1 /TAXON_ID=2838 /ORGANISM="Odontella" /LENGTH=667 /DNA_ID=CAMNT_0000433547 /DNA_START=378 /DNA_END=2385 /DNA_ORIENTATION=- /assembly_acc=CAM_ASM_000160
MVIRKVPRLRSMSRSSSASKFSASSSTDDAEAGEGIMNDGELRRQRKIDEISLCLNGYDQVDGCGGRSFEVDLWRLRELCLTKGGLVNAEMRQRAWHKLLGINASAMDDSDDGGLYARREAESMDAMDFDQEEMGLIRRDVGRSVYFRYIKEDDSDTAQSSSLGKSVTKADEDGCEIDGSEEARDSLTVSTCASTADGSWDPTTQSINQAANRLKNATLSSELLVDWGSCDSASNSPLASSEKLTLPSSPAGEEEDGVPYSLSSGDEDVANGKDGANETKKIKKTIGWELQNLLMSLILSSIAPKRSNSGDVAEDRLHYYQGFHDVVSVMLIQLGPDRPQLASAILRKLSRHNLRDNMREDFELLTASLEAAFFPLLKFFDEALHDFLTHCGLNSASVLSWVLTWFSHDVRDADTAGRLFDVFLASHAAMPIYLAVAVIAHPYHRKLLFANECCPAMLHVAVGGLLGAVGGSSCDWVDGDDIAQGVVTFQDLIDDAISFMRKVPPSALPSLAKRYKDVSSGSSPRLRRRRNDQDPIPISSVLVKQPPSWSVAPTVTADWVLEQQRRQSLQRHGKLPSRKKLIGATIKRKVSPRNNSLLKQPSQHDGTKCKEEHLKAKAAAGLAPALCDDDLEVTMIRGNMRRSSSSMSSSSDKVRTSARNAAGAFGT